MENQRNQRPAYTISPKSIITILIVCFIPMMLWTFFSSGVIGEYDWYAGPVLPLTSLSGGGNVNVERHVELDYANYENLPEWSPDPNTVIVTDSYALTNTSSEDVTVELVWGFEGQFTDPAEQFPSITVDGAPAAVAMYASTDPEGHVHRAYSFEKYKEVLTENDFLSIAMAETPEWDATVKVYHFYDMNYVGEEQFDMPLLDITYTLGESTSLWTRIYQSSGYETDTKRYRLAFRVSWEEAWLFVVGDDIQDVHIGGNQGYNIGDDTAIEGVTYELETYESTLMDCILDFSREYEYIPGPGGDPAQELVTPELLFDGAMKRIVGSSYQNPSDNVRMMDSVFGNVVNDIRMLYWVFPVEIPAGATVTVTGQYEQEVSYDEKSSTERWEGVDIATTLGSNLNFTQQTVTLINTHLITIADEGESQNFGFDPAKGVTTVTLDLETERYYLDVLISE